MIQIPPFIGETPDNVSRGPLRRGPHRLNRIAAGILLGCNPLLLSRPELLFDMGELFLRVRPPGLCCLELPEQILILLQSL